ncbi:DUF3021 family protein [Jeotgalicoccus sp. FSL K6-3177]|uniref:DUF3021 family protein n=1 Tax=Jeotgalicoccus sp. FSL K6-3177 TaxID=2921494 RepID=UPI00404B046C
MDRCQLTAKTKSITKNFPHFTLSSANNKKEDRPFGRSFFISYYCGYHCIHNCFFIKWMDMSITSVLSYAGVTFIVMLIIFITFYFLSVRDSKKINEKLNG